MKWRKNNKASRAKIPPFKRCKKCPEYLISPGHRRLLLRLEYKTDDVEITDIRIGYYNHEMKQFFAIGVTGVKKVTHFAIIRKPKTIS